MFISFERHKLSLSRMHIVSAGTAHQNAFNILDRYPNLGITMTYPHRRASTEVSTNMNHQKSSESVTIRFDKDALDRLRRESKDSQVSLNTVINHIAMQHLAWYAHGCKAGFIVVRKGDIVKMLEKISEKDVTEIAEYVTRKESKEFITMLRNEYTITSALDVIETWVKVAGYSYRHEVIGSEHFYIIQHDMGLKWSLYLKEQYGVILEDFGVQRADFRASQNIVVFKVNIEDSL
jgi:uncharacterized protein (DUF4415 family)